MFKKIKKLKEAIHLRDLQPISRPMMTQVGSKSIFQPTTPPITKELFKAAINPLNLTNQPPQLYISLLLSNNQLASETSNNSSRFYLAK